MIVTVNALRGKNKMTINIQQVRVDLFLKFNQLSHTLRLESFIDNPSHARKCRLLKDEDKFHAKT